MFRTHVIRAVLLFSAALLAGSLLGGCTPKTVVPVAQPTGGVSAAAPLDRMSADEKRSRIATSFPIEVPVVQGQVVRGEAQGADAWDYQLAVDAAPADVAEWYVSRYTSADWQLISDETAGSGRKLTFIKGGAQSQVVVDSEGDRRTGVTVILGVGAPVLDTQ